jgi:alkylation response protein AidB-like acyl-CoA dehydrogenase
VLLDFEYTPEQIALRKAVREFAEGEIAPHVMEWDEAQTFPLEVVRKLGQLGYMGAIFPEELRRRRPRLHRVLHHY